MSKSHNQSNQGQSEPGAPKPHTVTIEGEAFPSSPKRIDYLPVEIPAPGHYAEVADGILWLRIPMPMDLNHINLWLVRDDGADGEGWTLVDSGLNADMCKEAWAQIESKAFVDRPLKRIFITHLHPDHVGLAKWLQDRHRVPVWMSPRGSELTRMLSIEPVAEEVNAARDFMLSHGFNDREMIEKFFSGVMYRAGISGAPEVAYEPHDNEDIQIGADHWHIYETYGHAEGHQCLGNAKRKILISGDQVLPTISSNVSLNGRGIDRNPLLSYLDSLQRLSQLDAHTLVLPSHGRPFFGLQARAADLIAHHHVHLGEVLKACEQPKTAFDLVPVLFKRRLIGSHWMFAMGETIAHTEYLALSGKLTRQTDAAGIVRYVSEA
jgi:glyoxylase-like metal-dependent hydrolase (beta-lactamase superfamily II)